jgi:ribosomal protein L22
MSPERTPDAPEPPQQAGGASAPEDAVRDEPSTQAGGAAPDASDDVTAGSGTDDAGEPQDAVAAAESQGDQDAEGTGDAEADAEAGEDAEAAGDSPAGEGKPEAKKRRRTPRIRKGAAGKADDAEAAKEQPQARARRGKAAAPKAEASAPAKPAAPARKKASSSRARRRVVRARARYVRTSARKARMVCAHLQGKSVAQARAILAFAPRAVARDWSKLLESAVANAENNHELLEEDLIIREAYADEGPTIKRFRPRAMGRATPIRKRTSHLTITLQANSSQDKRAR